MLKLLKGCSLCLTLVILLFAAHAGVQQFLGNFHEVIPGELYRSGQPTAQALARYQKDHGVRTILNLRDEERGAWYQEEKRAAAALGIRLVDYPVSARGLDVAEAERLAMLMAGLPKPLLIHCEHGANRTGLASAIYLDAVAKRSDAVASRQLSPYYGHVPIKGLGRYALYKSYRDFQEASDM